MKKTRLLHTAFLAICLAAATSCTNDMDTTANGDKVQVQFTLPGSYSIPGTPGKTTKDSRAEENTQIEHPELKDEMLLPLEDGTTLWLAVYEEKEDGTYDDTHSELKSYVVRRYANEYSTLYTCEVDTAGNVISEDSAPLFLEAGKTYKFRAVSPAKKLSENEELHVKNGDYLLATDDRYEQTMSTKITIPTGNSEGVTYVALNPLLQQTARIRFSLEPGENVHRLNILPAGIEVSGIQDDVINNNMYNWSTSEPLHEYLGSKHSSITIKDFKEEEHNGHKHFTGEASVLPTDAISNSIVILLNLGVNSINSQYTMMLNAMQLEPAHSYNFEIKVKVENNITVAVWQSQSWETDMELKQTK